MFPVESQTRSALVVGRSGKALHPIEGYAFALYWKIGDYGMPHSNAARLNIPPSNHDGLEVPKPCLSTASTTSPHPLIMNASQYRAVGRGEQGV